MIFQDRYIDKDIRAEDKFMNLGIFQFFTVFDINFLIVALGASRNKFAASVSHSFLYSAVLIAFRPVVAGIIKNIYRLGSCAVTLFDDAFNQVRIGISPTLG